MNRITKALLDLKRLESFADGDSAIHRLNSCAKTFVVLSFVVAVVSYNRYEISGLLPFALFPIAIISQSGLPPLFMIKKILLLLPFVLCTALFNPIFDREILLQFGSISVSAGWVSFLSILIRSALTIGSAFILLGTTGFSGICHALRKIGLPAVFTTQLLFLHRYIFVLAEESARASLARELRSCGERGQGIASYGNLVGHLLLRTFGRAERVHGAMLARGFNGEFIDRNSNRFGMAEFRFMLGWLSAFICFRTGNIPLLIGNYVTRWLS